MDTLISIVNRGETLEVIATYAHPDLPLEVSSIRFAFTHAEVTLSVDPDTDQIVIRDRPDQGLVSLAFSESLFASLLQKRLTSVWRMQNDQGYYDGIQLAFENERGSVLVQFVAAASMLRVFSVMRWK